MMKNLKQMMVMILVAAPVVAGCKLAELKQAVVSSSDPVQAVSLLEFSPEQLADGGSLRLVNNRLFFWPETVTAQTVTRASQLAREIEILDDLAFPVNLRLNEVDGQYQAQKDLRKVAFDRIRAIRSSTTSLQSELASEQSKAVEEQNAELIASLQAQLTALADEKALKEADKAAAEERMSEIEPELSELEMQQGEFADRGQKAVASIMELVDWPKTNPESVSFRFARSDDGSIDPSGPMEGELRGWEFYDDQGPRTFSTELGTLADLRYEARGGVFTFKLLQYENQVEQDVLRYTYCLKLARTKYDRLKTDVRKFFAGDILRVNGATDTCDFDVLKKRSQKDASLGIRLGVAKLVDRNN